jgi:hypothetical protein
MAAFYGRVAGVNDVLVAKLAGVTSELHRRRCAEAVAKAQPDFMCPISHALIRAPVLAADSHSYERREITKWFAGGHLKSPLTGSNLTSTTLFPNITLKKAIERAMEAEAKEVELKKQYAEEMAARAGGSGGRAGAAAEEAEAEANEDRRQRRRIE